MSREDLEPQGLRDAFATLAAVAGDGTRCPESGRLWASALEELSGRENEEIILHLGECTACATAWRLARELSVPEGVAVPAATPTERRPSWIFQRWAPLAAAAVLVVGVGVLILARLPRRPVPAPVYRSRQGRWLESQLPAGGSLTRGAFVLRWVAGPKGTSYEVHMTTERLEPLAHASGLKQAEYRVEEAKLAKVASGARVLWRVIARLPDGRVVASRTFVTALE